MQISDWTINIVQNETDSNRDGIPDVIVTLHAINRTMIEIYVNDTVEKGGYKWMSALINVTGISRVEKFEYNPATKVWTNTGVLQYGILVNYGMPSAWGAQSGGKGFILFGSGSGDKQYRIKFNNTPIRSLKIYSGVSSNLLVANSGDDYTVTWTDETNRKHSIRYDTTNGALGNGAVTQYCIDYNGDGDLIDLNECFLGNGNNDYNNNKQESWIYDDTSKRQYQEGGNYTKDLQGADGDLAFYLKHSFTLYESGVINDYLFKQRYLVVDGLGGLQYLNVTVTKLSGTHTPIDTMLIAFYPYDASQVGGGSSDTLQYVWDNFNSGTLNFQAWIFSATSVDDGSNYDEYGQDIRLMRDNDAGSLFTFDGFVCSSALSLGKCQNYYYNSRNFTDAELTVSSGVSKTMVSGLGTFLDAHNNTSTSFNYDANAFESAHYAFIYIYTGSTTITANDVSTSGLVDVQKQILTYIYRDGSTYKAILIRHNTTTSAMTGSISWGGAATTDYTRLGTLEQTLILTSYSRSAAMTREPSLSQSITVDVSRSASMVREPSLSQTLDLSAERYRSVIRDVILSQTLDLSSERLLNAVRESILSSQLTINTERYASITREASLSLDLSLLSALINGKYREASLDNALSLTVARSAAMSRQATLNAVLSLLSSILHTPFGTTTTSTTSPGQPGWFPGISVRIFAIPPIPELTPNTITLIPMQASWNGTGSLTLTSVVARPPYNTWILGNGFSKLDVSLSTVLISTKTVKVNFSTPLETHTTTVTTVGSDHFTTTMNVTSVVAKTITSTSTTITTTTKIGDPTEVLQDPSDKIGILLLVPDGTQPGVYSLPIDIDAMIQNQPLIASFILTVTVVGQQMDWTPIILFGSIALMIVVVPTVKRRKR